MAQSALAKQVGANIAKRRKLLGWHQKYLASILGVSPETVTRIEKGIVSPSLSTVERIADALQCSVASLVSGYDIEHSITEKEQAICDLVAGLPERQQDGLLYFLSGLARKGTEH
ncbi:MAG: helix-turn-helix transcriptional regulator [Mailhella sp.]|nr:helix-turn-helix transcriptional regulator [Mailhella sp.]